MWECGSWHDSILVGDKVYYLKDLSSKLQLNSLPHLHLHRCAQVNKEMFLLVYQLDPGFEIYCYFNPDFEIVFEEKREIKKDHYAG